MREMIAAHAVLSLEMADDRFDSGTPSHLPFDAWRDAALLTRDEDLELVFGRRVVAVISGIGEDATGMILASVWPS